MTGDKQEELLYPVITDALPDRIEAGNGGQANRMLGIIAYGRAERGAPSYDEDKAHIRSIFGNDNRCAAFAVYDGHGGDEVSTYLKDSMLQAILD